MWSGSSRDSVSVNSPTALDVTVDPPTFAFSGGDRVFADGFDGAPLPPAPEFQTLTITATPTDVTFAEIVFHEASGLAPDAHFFVSVQGSPQGPFSPKSLETIRETGHPRLFFAE